MSIENRKAYHDYYVEDAIECGISLRGNEVKSIRAGSCSIKEAWCQVQNGNLVVRGMFIKKWETANVFDVDETRERQLLAHRREINYLADKRSADGYTLIPLKVYFKNGKVKVLIGVCRGKKDYDKRNVLKERDTKREIQREMRGK